MNESKITIKLYGGLEQHIKDYHNQINYKLKLTSSNQKIIDVIKKLGIRKDRISLLLLNGVIVDLNNKLKEDDILKIYPPLGGG